MPTGSKLGRAAQRRAALATDPDRQGLLDRLGLKDNVGKGAIGPTVLRRILRPEGLHDAQRFIGAASTLGKRDPECLEFCLSPAHTRAENQTTLTELVNTRQFFREHNGMAV